MVITPVIEGNQATFFWYGAGQPQLIGDFNYWSVDQPPIEFELVGEGAWKRTLTLPKDAYLEYGLVVDGERIADPLNPNSADDGMGHTNSYFWMPDAHDTPLATIQPDVPQGTITTHGVDGRGYVVGSSRTVHLYRPATDEKTPLLVVFDGTGYVEKARLPIIVDNLIAQKRIRPISMALIDPGGTGRTVEYACSDTTVAFLMYCVLPLARQQLNLLDTPGAFGMMGASMGGLMSLYTALRAPEIFGRVLSQSGAFRGDFIFYRSVIHDLIDYMPPQPVRVFMDAGRHEWFIDSNREMAALLDKRGYDVRYHEHNSGHNYPSWRNHVAAGLEFLFSYESH